MKKIFFFFLLFALGFTKSISTLAQDSSHKASTLRFSLLTCDAGDDLYTIWGHTAIRIVDSSNNTDIVYNFGSFDFNTPNFIGKFMKGDLLYFISANTYSDFLYEYQYYKRDVHEQVLKLKPEQKQQWLKELQINSIGDNRFYLYNFITDNCTTRIKDGLFKHAPINEYSIGIRSFREEVVRAPYRGGLGWVGLGIDLLLGAVADKTPSLFQEAFLPSLLYKKMALNPHLILESHDIKFNNNTPSREIPPVQILIVFLLFYIFVSSWNTLTTQRIARVIDISLLLLLGIGGALVLYMSFISLHTACHENYNIIWLHPVYLIAIPLYFISKKWTSYIGWLFFACTIAFMVCNYWIPQHFSQTVIACIAISLFLQIRLIKRGQYARFK